MQSTSIKANFEKKFFIIAAIFLGVLVSYLLISAEKGVSIAVLILFSLISLSIATIFPKLIVYCLIIAFPIIASLPRGQIVPYLKLDEILIIAGVVLTTIRYGIRHTFTKIDFLLISLISIGILTTFLGALVRHPFFQYLSFDY